MWGANFHCHFTHMKRELLKPQEQERDREKLPWKILRDQLAKSPILQTGRLRFKLTTEGPASPLVPQSPGWMNKATLCPVGGASADREMKEMKGGR